MTNPKLRTSKRIATNLGPWAVAASIALSFGLSPEVANASQTFPAAVQQAVELECAPSCTLCHQTLEGGAGTVDKPFGIVLQELGGLRAGDPGGIAGAITTVENAACSGDPIPVADCEAGKEAVSDLQAGLDPQSKAPLCESLAKYGCGANVAPLGSEPREPLGSRFALFTGLLVAAGLVLGRRKRAS